VAVTAAETVAVTAAETASLSHFRFFFIINLQNKISKSFFLLKTQNEKIYIAAETVSVAIC
jgi:hypothetical protein